MRIMIDDSNRIHMIDDFHPFGSIIFDLYSDTVAVYQDAENKQVRTAFEKIDESAEFSREELVNGLKEIVELLEGVDECVNAI